MRPGPAQSVSQRVMASAAAAWCLVSVAWQFDWYEQDRKGPRYTLTNALLSGEGEDATHERETSCWTMGVMVVWRTAGKWGLIHAMQEREELQTGCVSYRLIRPCADA